jgi:transcriptional regulator with XRE-family HTH domain
MKSAEGQTRHFRRGVERPIPADVFVPICDQCAEVFMSPADSARVDAALRAALRKEQALRLQALVGVLRKRNGATQREVEQACAVTPSYLSHVLSGRRLASETLVRLIEAFVQCSSEFERYRTGVAARPHAFDALLLEKAGERSDAIRSAPLTAKRDAYVARGHPSAHDAREGVRRRGYVEHLH